ncbi:MAG: hypothetical protein NTX81_01665 [Candidatus Bathyarchaeota archaeon]|nr:hypothetical protein [Candidatus Bathyarchaeota archaeon]
MIAPTEIPIPKELIAIIHGLPIQPKMKERLCNKIRIVENPTRKRCDACVFTFRSGEWNIYCRNINRMLITTNRRFVLYHELAHIILEILDEKSFLRSTYDCEEHAWMMAEVFMGKSSRRLKLACLNNHRKTGIK